jgi:hypothetical protein
MLRDTPQAVERFSGVIKIEIQLLVSGISDSDVRGVEKDKKKRKKKCGTCHKSVDSG